MPTTFQNALRINCLYADRYTFSSLWVYPENSVPYSMLRFIQNGSARFVIDQREFVASKNQIVYIPEGSRVFCESLEENFTFTSVRFTVTFPLYGEEVCAKRLNICEVTDCTEPEIHRYFDKLLSESTSRAPGQAFRLQGYLELLIGYLLDQSEGAVEEPPADERYQDFLKTRDTPEQIMRRNMRVGVHIDPRIQAVVEYLIANPSDKINIQQMCGLIDMSESSLRRLFKAHTGKSPTEFLCELRMMYAAKELIGTRKRIAAIAGELGFDDPNYFTRRFRRTYGISPMQYRQISRR